MGKKVIGIVAGALALGAAAGVGGYFIGNNAKEKEDVAIEQTSDIIEADFIQDLPASSYVNGYDISDSYKIYSVSIGNSGITYLYNKETKQASILLNSQVRNISNVVKNKVIVEFSSGTYLFNIETSSLDKVNVVLPHVNYSLLGFTGNKVFWGRSGYVFSFDLDSEDNREYQSMNSNASYKCLVETDNYYIVNGNGYSYPSMLINKETLEMKEISCSGYNEHAFLEKNNKLYIAGYETGVSSGGIYFVDLSTFTVEKMNTSVVSHYTGFKIYDLGSYAIWTYSNSHLNDFGNGNSSYYAYWFDYATNTINSLSESYGVYNIGNDFIFALGKNRLLEFKIIDENFELKTLFTKEVTDSYPAYKMAKFNNEYYFHSTSASGSTVDVFKVVKTEDGLSLKELSINGSFININDFVKLGENEYLFMNSGYNIVYYYNFNTDEYISLLSDNSSVLKIQSFKDSENTVLIYGSNGLVYEYIKVAKTLNIVGCWE